MIVCNLCGASVHLQGAKCERCSGKGIVTSSPLRLHPSGSPGSDKWANLYTKTPPASPLGRSQSPKSPKVTSYSTPSVAIDVLVPDNGQTSLTRVHGCVLDPKLKLPDCEVCNRAIQAGNKLYTAPRPGPRGFKPGATMCRACFASHFKLGVCNLCHLDVLGDRDEGFGGLHVKGRGVIWHGRCFVCTGCAVNLAKIEHSVDPRGNPHCLDCAIKREESQEQPPKRVGRYMLPSPKPRQTVPIASTSCAAPTGQQSRDTVALRTAVAVKAKIGVVMQMKEVFEATGR